eukprot:TRINITY_DN3391_c0_g1_i1.p4 TRINITY_DN3391_c0_g1~~TRINITY_DN3391_c0_g1_i1.p4  ORF type:complete len:76 (-),score=15.30 TRINITY_DN3391_c0_g1_i1:226-426(-)
MQNHKKTKSDWDGSQKVICASVLSFGWFSGCCWNALGFWNLFLDESCRTKSRSWNERSVVCVVSAR